MSLLPRIALALALVAATSSCAADLEPQLAESRSLCELACERRADAGCVTDLPLCSATCDTARAAGTCTAELDVSLACVADAERLVCGRAPNGGSCDDEALALEHCIAAHSFDEPSDCYGHECSWECGPIGQKLCTPGMTYLCECPSGASGQRSCSSDGCFFAPCDCAE